MLYAISNKIPKYQGGVCSHLEQSHGIKTMNTESAWGLEILKQKRNFVVVKVDAKDLYQTLKNYSATVIMPDDSTYQVKIKDNMQLFNIVNYKPKNKYSKFVDRVVNIMKRQTIVSET